MAAPFGQIKKTLATTYGGLITPATGGGSVTQLARQPNGTVTVMSLGSTWTPKLTRQSDGTVTVGA